MPTLKVRIRAARPPPLLRGGGGGSIDARRGALMAWAHAVTGTRRPPRYNAEVAALRRDMAASGGSSSAPSREDGESW